MEIILLFIVFLNILLGGFIFVQNPKSTNNRLFSLMSFVAAMWTFANYRISIYPSTFWIAGSYALGAFLISIGLLWTFFITGHKLNRLKMYLIIFFAIFFCLISFKPDFIPPRFQYLSSNIVTTNYLDWSLLLYSLFYLSYGSVILYKLYKSSLVAKNSELKMNFQFKYIFIGASITLITTALNSFILPFSFIYISKGIDSLGFFVFLLLVTYTITKHHLFNIKIIFVQLIVSTLLVFMFIRVSLAGNPRDFILESAIFLIILVFGVLLIQNVLQNIQQRQEIENLTQNLKRALDLEPYDHS